MILDFRFRLKYCLKYFLKVPPESRPEIMPEVLAEKYLNLIDMKLARCDGRCLVM